MTLYAQHLGAVRAALRRFGAPVAEIDDLAHDVFVTALERGATRDHRPARPWLLGIAARLVSHLWRSHRSRQWCAPRVESAPERMEAPSDARFDVACALDSLDPARRAVLVMHDVEERSAPEIAIALVAPLNTVYSRLRSARLMFAEAYA